MSLKQSVVLKADSAKGLTKAWGTHDSHASNLYEDGLVCSSLLDQGSGWGHVTWRSGESNLVEVCKALMWVHMTAEVYFAEPDTEDLIGDDRRPTLQNLVRDAVKPLLSLT